MKRSMVTLCVTETSDSVTRLDSGGSFLSLPSPLPTHTRERAMARMRGSCTLAPAFGVTDWPTLATVFEGLGEGS